MTVKRETVAFSDTVDNVEETTEFDEGYHADRKGTSRLDCPYPNNAGQACLWQMGWHQSRMDMLSSRLVSENKLKREMLNLLEKHRV